MNIGKLLRFNYREISFVIIAFAVMIAAAYFSVGTILRNRLLDQANEMISTAEANVRSGLMGVETILLNSSHNIQNMIEQGASNKEIRDNLINTTEWMRYRSEGDNSGLFELNGIFGYINGEFIDGIGKNPHIDFIPQTRPWYQIGIRSGNRIGYTAPYIDLQTGENIISATRNLITGNDSMTGMLVVNINIRRLMDYVNSLSITQGGQGILISQNMTLMSYSDYSLIGSQVHELGGDYAKIAQTLRSGNDVLGQRIKEPNGTSSIVFFTSIINGWYLGITIPYHSFYHDLYIAGFILGALGIALSLLLCYILLRLSDARIRADEESKSKTKFLANMSHEIRTPMNAITGMAELALRNDLTPEVRGFIQDIKHAGSNLISIINGILDISKIEAGKLEITPVKYQISSLVNDVVNIIRTRLLEKSIWLETYVEESLPNGLTGDEVRIKQIIINLLSNAVKYTDRGSIFFGITKDKNSSDSSQVWIKITVVDTGKGIKPEDQEKLFKDFVQVDTKKNKGIEGTGLGLAITKRLVEAMGGKISVNSDYGRGSTFTVILPQKIHSYDPVGVLGNSITNRDEKPFEIVNTYPYSRILIVDDLPANLKVAEGLLEPYMVVVDVCESGAEALELIKFKKYDLIFMDHMMPEMDGMEATKRIREWEKEKGDSWIPIIALTANAVSGMKEKFIENGFDDFLAKPIDIMNLDKILERWLGDTVRNEELGIRNEKRIEPRDQKESSPLIVLAGTESGEKRIENKESKRKRSDEKRSIGRLIKNFFINVATSGRYAEGSDFTMSDYYVRYVLMNFIIFFGTFLLSAFTVNNVNRGAYFDAISCGTMAVIAIFTFILARTKVKQVVPVSIMMIFYGIFCALLTWYGDAQGAGVLFIYVYPVLTTMMLGMKSSIILSSALIIIVSLEMFVPGLSYYAYHIDISSRIVASYFLVFSVTLVMEITRRRKDKRIEEQNKWLQELREKSEAANRAKSDFLANISHEIRTPMNTITGMNELVLRSDISDEVRSYSQDIKKAEAHLTSIINDILNFTENGNIQNTGSTKVISDIFSNQLQIPGVDTAKGFANTGRSIEKYKQVLEVLCENIDERLSLLQNVPNEENLPVFITQVHALKGALATIGAQDLSIWAEVLEKAGNNNNFKLINEKLSMFVNDLKKLQENIRIALK